ncbi:MAG TPA: DoxX family protein [Opitutaceae bacterium]|nr:DoxX family protein [Opitutaceae bacterium]
MATTVNPTTVSTHDSSLVTQILRLTYGIVPIVAGLDKFTNLLTHWSNYLNPALAHLLPFGPEIFMRAVGVIEIIAGLLVLTKPRLGAAIVAVWLTLIALSLLAGWSYVDVAVRDLVMAVGAFSLARLSPRS